MRVQYTRVFAFHAGIIGLKCSDMDTIIASYKKVFGNTRTFGLLSGNSKDFDTDYLFSTMQMMAKPEILSKFQRDEFETIIIDEYDIIGQVRRRPILKAS